MKFWRYRRPSVNNVLGVTRMKKRFYRKAGITAMKRPGRMPENYKRWAMRKVGYESTLARLYRHGVPTAGGCLWLVIVVGAAPVIWALRKII